jgi:hypothetical protein
MSPSRTARSTARVALKPADPFDLLRLIARSQSDPRKAVAELVQNSLDAGATHVALTRLNAKGKRALSILDDGRGVFPDLSREDALRRIATTIGRSYKARLSPAERHRQMTLGKYGIGLLGFWSIGRFMEIRSRVGGSQAWVLRMEEDHGDAELAPLSGRLSLPETFTEVVIHEVHAAADPQLLPRRLAVYLAGELRGQLLARDVELLIHDRIGRGLAQKRIRVQPQRFQGLPVEIPTELPIAGFAPARVELYLVPADEVRPARVALACGGATVLDDMAAVDGTDAPREPWSLGRFEGVIDVPDLQVAPSTRRSFVPNEASRAFLDALPGLEARCRAILAADAEQRAHAQHDDDARDLRRMFRRVRLTLPQYALFSVKRGSDAPADGVDGTTEGLDGVTPKVDPLEGSTVADLAVATAAAPSSPDAFLFPVGPLSAVEIRPRRSVLAPGAERALKAVARDADGREIEGDVGFEWALAGAGSIAPEGATVVYTAPADPCEATATVVARQDGRSAEAAALLRVTDAAKGGDEGIPEPKPVAASAEPWRSRIQDGEWQYNTSHPDYRRVQDDARRRLRYLVHLFAKELVVRNFGDPSHADLLERMVEVLTHVGDTTLRRAGAAKAADAEAG